MDSLRNFYERWKQKAQDNPRKTAIWVGIVVLFFLGFLMPVDPPHVALSGQPLFSNGPKWFTNTVLTTIIIDLFLIIPAVLATQKIKMVPGALQNFWEMVLEYLFNLSESVAGKDARRYFPWVATIFLFVIVSNWSGLIPGVGSILIVQPAAQTGDVHSEEPAEHEEAPAQHEEAPADEGEHPAEEESDGHGYFWDAQLAMAGGNLVLVEPKARESMNPVAALAAEEGAHETTVSIIRPPSSDLNFTFALALITMFMVQFWGVKALGVSYFKKFFVWKGDNAAMKGINMFVGFLELISEFARIIAFGFRLFGNIFAGEIVLMTMMFLVAFLLPLPFYFLEILVGAVQALVFMMLALVFFSMSTQSHDHDH